MNFIKNLGLFIACTTALSAHGQTSKPGLWEVTSKFGGNPEMDKAMADMQKQMASMPPDQRKQMEAMMGNRGVTIAGPAGAMVLKTCITKEMVAQSQLPMQTQGNCTSTTSEKTSSSMKFKFVCTSPSSTGEGQFNFLNDTSYSSKIKMTSTEQGNAQITTVETAGKWMGSDCGTVKPMVMPKEATTTKP